MTPNTFLFTPFGEPGAMISALHAGCPPLLVTTVLASHRWFYYPDKETAIAHAAPLQREAILKYSSQRVVKQLPESRKTTWLRSHYLYYQPASAAEIVPVEFEINDERLFPLVEDEALVEWEKRKAEGDLSGNLIDTPEYFRTEENLEEEDEWPVPNLPKTSLGPRIWNWVRRVLGIRG